MPMFAYRGRDLNGELKQGQMEGVNSNTVADQLANTGIVPLEISLLKDNEIRGAQALSWQHIFAEKIGVTDLLLFSRQMHTLIKAGVPILRALDGLRSSTLNASLGAMLQSIRNSLDAGHELFVSLSQHPKVFSPFYISMVQVGEMTGRLDEIFLRLYHYLEFESEMRKRIKSALRYPVFVMAAMAIAIVVINIFVIPTFAKVYEGFKTELPLMTKGLIGFSDFMVQWWAVMLAALVALIIGIRIWLTSEKGQYQWDRYKLRLPIAGKIILKATLARFARGFALAFKSGVPVVQSMAVVAQVVDNKYIGGCINQMRNSVERGESILRTATSAGIFTPVVLQMIAVGEETGELDSLMEEVALMYEREVEYEVRTLSQQVEPILIIGLGGLVLVLALGVFLPIWDLGAVVK